MRRRLHSLIVALLCMTLGVDSATACWYLRHHGRGCSPAHRYATIAPSVPFSCEAAWIQPPLTWCGHVTDFVVHDRVIDPVVVDAAPWPHVSSIPGELLLGSECCADCAGSATTILVEEHDVQGDSVVVSEGIHHTIEQRTTVTPEAAVVHDPTIVVGGSPVSEPTAPASTEQDAKPARPVSPQPQLAAREPLPDLKPANAPAVVPAEQPVPASLDLPADDENAPAPTAGDEAAMAKKPVAAAVDELAGGPRVAAAPLEPTEENLFDLFTDEQADEMPAAQGENDEAEGEPEMVEEPAGEADADDKPVKQPAAEPAPADDDSKAVADPESAATVVPGEPMRLWTDATGDHHARGWLAELGADTVRILKVNGRYTTMAVADLSDADQAYVSTVAARVAARRAAANDTAGL